ncbi:MAG: hypothetical protein SGCHY_000687 [Lobulomycetales sp.]
MVMPLPEDPNESILEFLLRAKKSMPVLAKDTMLAISGNSFCVYSDSFMPMSTDTSAGMLRDGEGLIVVALGTSSGVATEHKSTETKPLAVGLDEGTAVSMTEIPYEAGVHIAEQNHSQISSKHVREVVEKIDRKRNVPKVVVSDPPRSSPMDSPIEFIRNDVAPATPPSSSSSGTTVSPEGDNAQASQPRNIVLEPLGADGASRSLGKSPSVEESSDSGSAETHVSNDERSTSRSREPPVLRANRPRQTRSRSRRPHESPSHESNRDLHMHEGNRETQRHEAQRDSPRQIAHGETDKDEAVLEPLGTDGASRSLRKSPSIEESSDSGSAEPHVSNDERSTSRSSEPALRANMARQARSRSRRRHESPRHEANRELHRHEAHRETQRHEAQRDSPRSEAHRGSPRQEAHRETYKNEAPLQTPPGSPAPRRKRLEEAIVNHEDVKKPSPPPRRRRDAKLSPDLPVRSPDLAAGNIFDQYSKGIDEVMEAAKQEMSGGRGELNAATPVKHSSRGESGSNSGDLSDDAINPSDKLDMLLQADDDLSRHRQK